MITPEQERLIARHHNTVGHASTDCLCSQMYAAAYQRIDVAFTAAELHTIYYALRNAPTKDVPEAKRLASDVWQIIMTGL